MPPGSEDYGTRTTLTGSPSRSRTTRNASGAEEHRGSHAIGYQFHRGSPVQVPSLPITAVIGPVLTIDASDDSGDTERIRKLTGYLMCADGG
jgi:hypothetical protein